MPEAPTMRRLMILILVLIVLSGVAGGMAYLQASHKNDEGTSCIYPGYGEMNARVLNLVGENVSLHVGESAEISGTVEGKAFLVDDETCHYSGHITLQAYLGPDVSKDSWSYMRGKLRDVEGLKVEISPSETTLTPGESVAFTLKVKPESAGTYYLYIVATSDTGWKSWEVIRVNVS